MKTVNVRIGKDDFTKEYYKINNNPYFNALKQTKELINQSRYLGYDKISFSYDTNGLTYLELFFPDLESKVIFNIVGR